MQIHCEWRCKSPFALQINATLHRNVAVDGALPHFLCVTNVTDGDCVSMVADFYGDSVSRLDRV
jgi:hypothetical protein